MQYIDIKYTIQVSAAKPNLHMQNKMIWVGWKFESDLNLTLLLS